MEPDFSGWATKAGLVCSDGRTIMPDAFKDQDKIQVPLVWQHGHKDPENVLGHAVLENRPGEGVYCYGFFNGTKKAIHLKEAVAHKDINQLSIWANNLVEKTKKVFHGKIREVSLVLSGANPGALIDNVIIRHSDGEQEELEGEVIIYTGLEFEHTAAIHDSNDDVQDVEDEELPSLAEAFEAIGFNAEQLAELGITHDDSTNVEDMTFQDVYDSMNDLQKELLHFMLGQALEDAEADTGDEGDLQVDNVDDTNVVSQDNLGDNDDSQDEDEDNTDPKGNDEMGVVKHNAFEATGDGRAASNILSHDDVKAIVDDASQRGSLKRAVEAYAKDHLEHGIQDIDILFPEAKTISDSPELYSRRTAWVVDLMGKIRKSPFSRIKTFSADVTVQEARAKGYVKGELKREEFFRVTRRVTQPTTVYKKQKLDRDDIIDITDFDIVMWLKAEMRIMFDEEIARAILLGDGRLADDEDKINEESIRPIATDHELYTTVVNVNIGDSNSSIGEALDAIVMNRSQLRGSGMPTMYTTETYIARFLLLKDTTGRKVYRNLEEVALDLRVDSIVPVEVMEEYTDILAVLVNPVDYVVGTDKGGEVSFFDDFDIDYNQLKYLMEARMSGALTKLKSAMVIKTVPANAVLVVPAAPTFDGDVITIHDTTGVIYRRDDTDAVVTSAATVAVADGVTLKITAEPASGYYFASSNDDEWEFTGEPS